jgi:hypothetical protein
VSGKQVDYRAPAQRSSLNVPDHLQRIHPPASFSRLGLAGPVYSALVMAPSTPSTPSGAKDRAASGSPAPTVAPPGSYTLEVGPRPAGRAAVGGPLVFD